MMSREFNRDDVDELKRQQVAGEGTTDYSWCSRRRPTCSTGPREELVERENADRTLIMRRAIQLDRELTDRDLPLLRRIFHRLNVQAAPPGARVQRDDGRWHTVVGASRR